MRKHVEDVAGLPAALPVLPRSVARARAGVWVTFAIQRAVDIALAAAYRRQRCHGRRWRRWHRRGWSWARTVAYTRIQPPPAIRDRCVPPRRVQLRRGAAVPVRTDAEGGAVRLDVAGGGRLCGAGGGRAAGELVPLLLLQLGADAVPVRLVRAASRRSDEQKGDCGAHRCREVRAAAAPDARMRSVPWPAQYNATHLTPRQSKMGATIVVVLKLCCR